MPNPFKEKLLKILKEKSYREGDFTLASGKKSSFYLDVKETALDPEGAFMIGTLAVETLQREGITPYAVGGLTLGADPLATNAKGQMVLDQAQGLMSGTRDRQAIIDALVTALDDAPAKAEATLTDKVNAAAAKTEVSTTHALKPIKTVTFTKPAKGFEP